MPECDMRYTYTDTHTHTVAPPPVGKRLAVLRHIEGSSELEAELVEVKCNKKVNKTSLVITELA